MKRERASLLTAVITDKLHWDRKPLLAPQTMESGFTKGTGFQAQGASLPPNSTLRPHNWTAAERSNAQT